MNAVECESISCSREAWNGLGPAGFESVSLHVAPGEVVGFCGPDGCGKGLLLNALGLLERVDCGRLRLTGEETTGLSDEEAAAFRNETCGFLFRHPYLLPTFSVSENVAMPLFRIRGGDAPVARERTLQVLEFAGIPGLETPLAGKLPPALRWRAALARAIVHGPEILVAISPPPEAGLIDLARRAADELGIAVLWAGERAELEPCADRIFEIREGRLA